MAKEKIKEAKMKLKEEEEPKKEEEVEKQAEDKEDEHEPHEDWEEKKKCNKEALLKAVEEDEDIDDEDLEKLKAKKKSKKMIKKEGELNPEESNAEAKKPEDTITTAPVIGQTQDIFVPTSSIAGDRMATGNSSSPSEVSFSGKSAEPELMKSPLYMNLAKQLDSMTKAFADKMSALDKSMTDRIANVQKCMSKVEEFYNKPFYKAVDDQVSPEGAIVQSVTEQMSKGKVRFTN